MFDQKVVLDKKLTEQHSSYFIVRLTWNVEWNVNLMEVLEEKLGDQKLTKIHMLQDTRMCANPTSRNIHIHY